MCLKHKIMLIDLPYMNVMNIFHSRYIFNRACDFSYINVIGSELFDYPERGDEYTPAERLLRKSFLTAKHPIKAQGTQG